jgi:hypothetical protein
LPSSLPNANCIDIQSKKIDCVDTCFDGCPITLAFAFSSHLGSLDNCMKNIVWQVAFLQSKSVYFALWAKLQIFKMVPNHFVWILFFAVPYS